MSYVMLNNDCIDRAKSIYAFIDPVSAQEKQTNHGSKNALITALCLCQKKKKEKNIEQG